MFELAVGFCGASVLPQLTANPLSKLVQMFFVDGCSIEYSLQSSVVANLDLLRHTPVAYIARENGQVSSMAIGVHATPSNAWGIVWKYCGNQRCTRPKEIHSTNVKGGKKVKQRCLRCKWESDALAATDLGWLKQWSSTHPLVYTLSHPIDPRDLLSFVSGTKDGKDGKDKKKERTGSSGISMEVD